MDAVTRGSTWLGFLSPEDVVAHAEPTELTHRLAAGFESDDEAAFVAANRLALEAFRARDIALAARICHLEIGYAATGLKERGAPRLALYGLQPVINLIRLDGYAADLQSALEGLAKLERIADGEPVQILGLDLDSHILSTLDGERSTLQALARNNCLVETAKILWRRRCHDQLLRRCARLLRKWPAAASSGPFHAAEAAWLLDPSIAAREGTPSAPVLRRICLLHAASGAPDAGLLDELYMTRAEAHRLKPSLAAARDLACLGDSLMRGGDWARGAECLREAHDVAGGVDPALANLIRSRWLDYGPQAGPPPPVEPAGRLSPPDLARLAALAAARLM